MFNRLLSSATVAILVLLITALSAHATAWNVALTQATVDLVHLQSTAAPGAAYDVWLNHAPTCDACYWWSNAGAVKVFTDTVLIDQDVHWLKVGLDRPQVGDCACIYWGTYVTNPIGYVFGIRKRSIPYKLFLPLVLICS